ncbi:MAG: hypothetical protein V8Q77_03870 [Bacilli bacterium]
MGSRGAFVNVSLRDFTFNTGVGANQQTYKTVGVIDGVHVIVQDKGLSVKAPEYSHTANRTYAVIQGGKLKHLSFYDENHVLVKVIDFGHVHDNKNLMCITIQCILDCQIYQLNKIGK